MKEKTGRMKGSKGSYTTAQAVVRQYMPHPKRFRHVWNKRVGDSAVYFWRPIPPNKKYIALGMCVTTTEDPPELDTVHCVPRKWVQPTDMQPKQIWNDAGTGGKAGSIWEVNEFGMMIAMEGHFPPEGTFFKLRAEAFQLQSTDVHDAVVKTAAKTYQDMNIEEPSVVTCDEYYKISDEPVGSKVQGSWWRPVVPPGYVYFGDQFQLRRPRGERDLPLTQALIAPDNTELFAKPADWKRVWKKKSGAATGWGAPDDNIMLWRAVPPSTDYVCLGDVADRNVKDHPLYKQPPTFIEDSAESSEASAEARSRVPELECFRCVHKALLSEKPMGQRIWDDKGTWGLHGSIWANPPPGNLWTFTEETNTAPVCVSYSLLADHTPLETRQVAKATRKFTAEDPKQQLSFDVGETFIITYDEMHTGKSLSNLDAWVEGYALATPDKRAFIPLSCIEFVTTRSCVAGDSGDKRFTKGDPVVALEYEGTTWKGFLTKDPTKIIEFDRSSVAPVVPKEGDKAKMTEKIDLAKDWDKSSKIDYVFFHLNPEGKLEPFAQEDNVLIAAAEARKMEKVQVSDVTLSTGRVLNFE